MEDTLRIFLFGVNRYSVKNAKPGQYWYGDTELEFAEKSGEVFLPLSRARLREQK
jgi:hypothetical protein